MGEIFKNPTNSLVFFFYFTGEGILISSNPHELIAFVDKQKQAHVLQKYVENPFLLEGNRKFDIR